MTPVGTRKALSHDRKNEALMHGWFACVVAAALLRARSPAQGRRSTPSGLCREDVPTFSVTDGPPLKRRWCQAHAEGGEVKGIQTMAGAKGNQTLVARLAWALMVRSLGNCRVVDARAVHRVACARECALRSRPRPGDPRATLDKDCQCRVPRRG
jgi:hypothetical protein